MIAPNGSQQNLQTIVQWRYCSHCTRSAPKRKLAGDSIWVCLWCFAHEPEDQDPPAPLPADKPKGATDGQ
jgi:hypothetical protein